MKSVYTSTDIKQTQQNIRDTHKVTVCGSASIIEKHMSKHVHGRERVRC